MGLFDYFSSFFKSKSKTVEELIRDGSLMAVRLLQNEAVRAELGLNAVQSGQVAALVGEARQKHRPGQAEGKERMERIAAVAADVLDGLDKSRVLTAEQQKRLKQVVWQQRGAAAFTDPALEELLQLSNAQKQALRGIIDGNQGKPAGGREKLLERRRESLEKALALLTPEQLERWDESKGRPFEIHIESGGQQGQGQQVQDLSGPEF